jgi:hypothetical protein
VVALVLAIASFMVCPLIPAIIALVIASQAKQEIVYSGGRVGGEGLVTAARIVAWINIAGCALLVVGVLLLIPVGMSVG